MENFNALLTLSELKTLYSGKPVGICPLYNGVLYSSKIFEATGNPITIPEYDKLIKLKTKFSPIQEGTGDPSPENVRPISGWSSVKVTVSNESESHDYTIPLPETIYGGTVDAVTGVGRMDYKLIEFNGTESWIYRTETDYFEANLFEANQYLPSSMSNIAQAKNTQYISLLNIGNAYSEAEDNIGWVFATETVRVPAARIRIRSITSVDALKTFLSAQQTKGTPLQICYQLAEPEPFKVSQISIPSLGNENTIFTTGENMDIIYKVGSFWG